MAVDADAYLESLQPPSIKIGGVTYTGEFLSIEEWLPFEPRFKKLANMGTDGLDLKFWTKLILDFCDLAFPIRMRDAWNPRFTSVGQRVLKLPPFIQMKVMADFFASQQRGLGTVASEALESGDEKT